jgi:large subunit ribosomal protein L4
MANVDVLNLNGEKVGSIELADALFAPDQVNEALLWEAVKHYRASLRQGTHKTKSRTEVAGSGKKLWKQKGTGRARIGSVRSPLWRHGYTVHGPQPRSYDYAFPRKKLLGALRSALASKLADGKLTVVDTLETEGSQDQALPRGAGQAGRDAHGAAGGERQDADAGAAAGRAQPGRA